MRHIGGDIERLGTMGPALTLRVGLLLGVWAPLAGLRALGEEPCGAVARERHLEKSLNVTMPRFGESKVAKSCATRSRESSDKPQRWKP